MVVATLVLADIAVSSLRWWLIVGLIAGFLASVVMRGGYGILGDIIAGVVGGFIGGWLFGVLGISVGSGLFGSILVAFIGACILIAILRLFSRSYPYRRL